MKQYLKDEVATFEGRETRELYQCLKRAIKFSKRDKDLVPFIKELQKELKSRR
jgi:hypothetical protein